MFFTGLPGGSPGRNAKGTWISLVIAFLVTATVAGGLSRLIVYAANFK